jgi:hypothetical protein
VQVYFLEPAGNFLLWFIPSDKANASADWKLPILATWITAGQSPTRTANLPILGIQRDFDWSQRMLDVFRPAVLPLPPPLSGRTGVIDWKGGLVSGAVSVLVFAPLVLWLATRYALPFRALLGWTVFVLLGGFPALLAFLSVQEWPGREACANCRKPRVVDRELCEHCGADFPPPDKIGTEIFAPAATG